MAQLPESLSAAYSYCGRGVRPYPDGQIDANVLEERALTKANATTLDDSIELGFPR